MTGTDSDYKIVDEKDFVIKKSNQGQWGNDNPQVESPWKIHLSVSPSDVEKAMNLIEPILVANKVPMFKYIKVENALQSIAALTKKIAIQKEQLAQLKASGQSDLELLNEYKISIFTKQKAERLYNGGQITLYLERSDEKRYNGILDQIEKTLKANRILPGQKPDSDKAFGQFSSFRCAGVPMDDDFPYVDGISALQYPTPHNPFNAPEFITNKGLSKKAKWSIGALVMMGVGIAVGAALVATGVFAPFGAGIWGIVALAASGAGAGLFATGLAKGGSMAIDAASQKIAMNHRESRRGVSQSYHSMLNTTPPGVSDQEIEQGEFRGAPVSQDERLHVEGQHAEGQHVEGQHVEGQHVEGQHEEESRDKGTLGFTK